jgi:hypothetical protein
MQKGVDDCVALFSLTSSSQFNVEDFAIDFQHEAHKSADLCRPRHMKENS